MSRAALVLAVAACVVTSAQTTAPKASEIAAQIDAELAAAKVPGAAVAVVSGSETLARGYGIANVQTNEAMAANTLVQIGSVTKLLTALAIVNTLETRKLAATTPVGRYVQTGVPRVATTTFHHLLSQTSGLKDRPGDYGSDDEKALGQSVSELTAADFLLPAGTVFSYSNLGYAVAGAALEGLRKQPFADAMREALFLPMGMHNTTLRPEQATAVAHAAGHRINNDKPVLVRPLANDTRIWPAGYVWSAASDMVRLLEALLHKGRVQTMQGVPASVIARVTEEHTPMPNVFVGGHYGYGLMITRDRGVVMYEHGGTLPGFSAMIKFAPERGVGFAILSNLDNAPLRRIAQTVMVKSLGLEPADAPPARTETPLSPDQVPALLGRYRNRGTAELIARDGAVFLAIDEGPQMLVSRIGEDRYVAKASANAPGVEFVLTPRNGQAPAYLHVALWAYVKEGG